MREKMTSVEEAVQTIPAGSSLAIGGSLLRRQPMALVRELLRQEKGKFSITTWASSLATDLLAAGGALRCWEGIYVGFWWHGLAPNFRRAVQRAEFAVQDRSESYMTARFRAAAMGLPYLPVAPIPGVHSTRHGVETVTCPFTGQQLHAVPAADPDVTILHAYQGDPYGNIAWPAHRDSDDLDLIMASGARRLIVSVEEIISHEQIAAMPNLTYIPHTKVDMVCEAPFGAWPGSCDTRYDDDAEELERWLAAGRDPQVFADYLGRLLDSGSHAQMIEKLAGAERLSSLEVSA